jgi:hypothetical protein
VIDDPAYADVAEALAVALALERAS